MMDDLISRQAALDVVSRWFDLIELNGDICLDGIRSLPSSPNILIDSDTISRRQAIDALAKNMPSLTTPDGCGKFDHDIQVTDEAYVDCMQIIHELPSTQPEIIRCKDCMYWVAHDKRCVYLNHGFAPNMWCCHGRRADG